MDTLERTEGGVAYEPALLLRAWLYGYQRKSRSTRALEAACREDMGVVWLTGNRQPDHNALWRFWHTHREGIRGLFGQSVKVAIDLKLVGMAVQAQAVMEPAEATPTVLADGGYANAAQLSEADRCGYAVVTPPPNSWRDPSDPYHAAHFRHDPERGVVICPQGRELPLQRVREKNGRSVEVYRRAKGCKGCPVRDHGTKDRHGRTIDIQPGHAAVVAAHARWNHPQTAELYGLRAPVVEPVFAQTKQQMGFRRWTFRGLEGVRTPWAMLGTTWNLRVIMRHGLGRAPGGAMDPSGPPRPGGNRRPGPPARPRAIAGISFFSLVGSKNYPADVCAA